MELFSEETAFENEACKMWSLLFVLDWHIFADEITKALHVMK